MAQRIRRSWQRNRIVLGLFVGLFVAPLGVHALACLA
jgi:hypothetical protein